MLKHARTLAIAAVLVVALVCVGVLAFSKYYESANATIHASLSFATSDTETATIVRVVDGDTLIVSLDGQEQRVRLIGIDAPESVSNDPAKNCEEGVIAAEYTASLVSPGQVIWMVKDVSNTDKYGRLLRYVWFNEPKQWLSDDDLASQMLNAHLVAEGYAQAKDYEPDVTYSEVFRRIGKSAILSQAGVSYLWA